MAGRPRSSVGTSSSSGAVMNAQARESSSGACVHHVAEGAQHLVGAMGGEQGHAGEHLRSERVQRQLERW